MCKYFLGAFLFALLLIPGAGHAQCTGGLIDNCPAAVSPQPTDLGLVWQNGQSPHTRSATFAQIVNGALVSPLTQKLITFPSASSGAGLNLGNGSPPNPCTNGDVWMTGSGLFSCVNSTPVGPYGTGGSVLPVFSNAASLPAVTAANAGGFAFVSNCLNGSQSGSGGTGCPYVVNNAGTWTALPYPPSQPITVGGQALYIGGATTNQGLGPLILTCSGTFVSGNALTTNSSGTCIDSGTAPSGGTGGGGTVANSASANAIPFYPAPGSTISPLSVVANAVLGTSGTGVPVESTTLPPGLTIPSPTIAAATLTGNTSISTLGMTGKLTTVASAATAGFNIQPGSAPTTLVNGDVWGTSTGLFGRVNGATQGPFVASVAGTSPIVISGGGTAALTATCPTCATVTSGGALSGTSPISISSSGVISLGVQPAPIVWIADSATNVHNDTYNLIEKWPWTNSGTINNIIYHTGGTSTPTFNVTFAICTSLSCTNITGCTNLSVVGGAGDVVATCTAANTILTNQALEQTITAVSGSPSSAVIQVNYSKPAS